MSDLKENFFDKVEKRDDGEWHWTGSTNNDGYPKIKDNGKLRLASHVALELAGRSAPEKGRVVMHRDNKPGNVNPANLRVSTQKMNLKHMRDQGRDRPRGVDQEPDVKQASGTQPLPPAAQAMGALARKAFKKISMAAFAEEFQKIWAAKI